MLATGNIAPCTYVCHQLWHSSRLPQLGRLNLGNDDILGHCSLITILSIAGSRDPPKNAESAPEAPPTNTDKADGVTPPPPSGNTVDTPTSEPPRPQNGVDSVGVAKADSTLEIEVADEGKEEGLHPEEETLLSPISACEHLYIIFISISDNCH